MGGMAVFNHLVDISFPGWRRGPPAPASVLPLQGGASLRPARFSASTPGWCGPPARARISAPFRVKWVTAAQAGPFKFSPETINARSPLPSGRNMGQGVFYRYRRRLPHWRLPGAVYFVTWRLHRRQRALDPFERGLIVDALRHFDAHRYDLSGYVVMNDHVHVLLSPRRNHELQSILHSWKSFTAHQLRKISGRTAPVWQDETHDRIVRDQAEMRAKLNYILNNPRRRWPSMQAYPWVWVVGLSSP